ncbi:MAG TPA: hypothetical protein VEC58_08340 [Roseiarcus sp.]|nr:hypothetical protein [Roseiarcus sp.]
MPLTHVDRPGLETPQGVHFPMMDGDRSVRVLVTCEAMAGKSVGAADGSYLARFVASRDLYEFVAREKFDPKRPVAKIEITYEDVLRAYQQLQALQAAAEKVRPDPQPVEPDPTR